MGVRERTGARQHAFGCEGPSEVCPLSTLPRPTHCPTHVSAVFPSPTLLQASLGPAAGAACMSMSLDEDGGLGGQGQGQQPGAGGGGVA